jgi:hypothetical protein
MWTNSFSPEREVVILPPLPDDNPEDREWHLQHLLKFYDDYKRVTRSKPQPKPDKRRRDDLLRDDECRTGTGTGTGTETGTPEQAKVRRRATKEQLRMRLALVREWLVDGWPSDRILHVAQEKFHLRRRMAQLYLRRAKQCLANEAAGEDYLAHLQLSRLQNEKLYQLTMQEVERIGVGENPRVKNSLLRTAGQLLKRRDEVVSIAVEHRAAVSRDRSPDADQEKLKRRGVIEMPVAEWFERLSNMHYTWRLLWEKEKAMPFFDQQLREQGKEHMVGTGIEYEIIDQMHERMRQAKQTVDPEIVKELELDDIVLPGTE